MIMIMILILETKWKIRKTAHKQSKKFAPAKDYDGSDRIHMIHLAYEAIRPQNSTLRAMVEKPTF